MKSVYSAVRTGSLHPILRSAHTVFVCFVFIWEQTTTCATYSINWLVFITGMKSVYCAVRTGSLHPILRSAHTVFMCFVFIWKQTTTCATYSITWLVFITEIMCLQRGTDWVFKYSGLRFVFKGLKKLTLCLIIKSNYYIRITLVWKWKRNL